MECVLENITVHYESFGEGEPIVILPGWGGNTRQTAHDLEPIFQEREGWKRIYIDPPGHGKTPGKDWITDQDKMLEVVLASVDKLTAGQCFSVIGISLGAYLARGVRYHRAELIDGMALIVPVIAAEDEKRTVSPYTVLFEDPVVVADLSPTEAEVFKILVIRSRKVLNYIRNLLQYEGRDTGFLDKIRKNPQKYAFSFDVDNVPEPFSGPSLIITGRQDPVVGYQDAWQILETYPRATYVVLDGTGHFLEEKEDLVHVLINEWLDRVEESLKSG